jgi:prepilin-type processing-associated H-X9-DG protein
MAKEDFAKFAAQVAAHCDFVYLGGGTKSSVDAGVVVAYEKPGPNTPDGISVAFQDGHVEFITWLRLPAAFEATNAFLKKAGKPEVDVEALNRRANPVGTGLP